MSLMEGNQFLQWKITYDVTIEHKEELFLVILAYDLPSQVYGSR